MLKIILVKIKCLLKHCNVLLKGCEICARILACGTALSTTIRWDDLIGYDMWMLWQCHNFIRALTCFEKAYKY